MTEFKGTKEEKEANSNLISAAPELLSICQEFVKINEQFLFDSSSRRILRIEPKLWCKLQDAISKALGKEIIDF